MMNSLEEKSLPQKISEDIISLILEENLQPGDNLGLTGGPVNGERGNTNTMKIETV